jgi:hypothetical protein
MEISWEIKDVYGDLTDLTVNNREIIVFHRDSISNTPLVTIV